MASVTYGMCDLWQVFLMANVLWQMQLWQKYLWQIKLSHPDK